MKPKRNKPYKPKPVSPNIIAHVLEGIKPPSDEKQLKLSLNHWEAFDAVTKGCAQISDVVKLIEMVDMAQIFAEVERSEEWFATAIKGKKAMRSLLERQNRLGKIGFSGTEMNDVKECLIHHESVISVTPVKTIERVSDILRQRVIDKERKRCLN